ncbi:hypothetical protein E4T43_09011 [Aureobasidium subglaciale]|nr:hypothetical protein E4T43_09011 [Aureobasidium subglaciale]
MRVKYCFLPPFPCPISLLLPLSLSLSPLETILTHTSSIDTQTDLTIQALIRKEFSSHTIISVAHKLETIVDFDIVGVMEDGKLVEVGDPKVLLKQEGSLFRGLWEER